jgi:5'-3' exonuclease
MTKSFTDINSYNDTTLMVVDALNLAFRYKHAKSHDFAEDYVRVIDSLKKSYKAGKVIIAGDMGSSSYRKAIYPQYKQNRSDKYAEQTPEEALEFEMFFEEFNKAIELVSEKYPVLRFNKVEADDIAAYICKTIKQYPIDEVWLISSDKDWDLLINEQINRFSYVTRKEITNDNWYEHYDCDPDQYISIKCLMGDSGDNVKGVEGIGPKRAAELIKTYGSAFDIVAALPITSKYKYIQSLNSAGDTILLNYQLMDLVTYCNDALGENTKEIDKLMKEYLK